MRTATRPAAPPLNRIASNCLRDVLPGIDAGAMLQVDSSIFEFSPEAMPLLLPYEHLVLAAIVRHSGARRLLEFGTARGRSALLLAANSPDDAVVLSVDLPEADLTDYSLACMEGKRALGEIVRRSSLSGKFRQLHPEQVADLHETYGPMDFILVDGDHSYAGVRADTEKALALCHPNTIIVWHDFYTFPSYVSDTVKDRGVFRYLNEIAEQDALTLRHITGTYFVIGSAAALAPATGHILQPGEVAAPFGDRIVRLAAAG